ncbi:MAG: Rrf2 family transcriptional regulator [Planctomycetaceae bacterium]|nr:Rrf2 family transcriptional regulator [Planctomycetaceae bacterium]
MELIRRDTDYALRLAAKMAKEYAGGQALSARTMARENRVSYPLACKLLQKMAQAGIVESTMGPKGGFRLAHEPAEIALSEIVEAVQGPICVNKCSDAKFACPMKCQCGLHPKMMDLQRHIHDFLYNLSLREFLNKGESQ